MIYCTKCGNAVDETQAQFCNRCGAQIPQMPTNYNQPMSQPSSQPYYGQSAGQSAGQPYYSQPMSQPYTQVPLPLSMSWYKFLICFSLFASAILSVVSGILDVTGNNLMYISSGMEAESFYDAFGSGLKALDILTGIFSIISGIYCIVVRQQLAHFKKSGPSSLYILLAFNLVISIIYLVGALAIFGDGNTSLIVVDTGAFSSSQVKPIAINIAWLIGNVKYFNERKHLFIN